MVRSWVGTESQETKYSYKPTGLDPGQCRDGDIDPKDDAIKLMPAACLIFTVAVETQLNSTPIPTRTRTLTLTQIQIQTTLCSVLD